MEFICSIVIHIILMNYNFVRAFLYKCLYGHNPSNLKKEIIQNAKQKNKDKLIWYHKNNVVLQGF